jgi:hypothetical protein
MVFSRGRVTTLLGVLLGLALTSTMVVRTTQAVFNNTTQTSANGWSTGGAAITNDYAATAPFSVAADSTLTGGQTLQKCLVVTYNGTTVPASVKLYASSVSGALAPYLTLVVDQGTGGAGSGSCTGFNVGTSGIYSGTLAGFGTAATQFSNGVGSWAPNTIGATQTYRFTITVQNVPGAQNATAAGVFTWEAQG